MASKFAAIMRDAQHGTVVKPLLNNWLVEANFPHKFSVDFDKGDISRDPDGWFHPSEHPSWHPRQLYYLITQGMDLEKEVFEYKNTMAVTVGKALHGFIEMCLKDMGLLLGEDRLRELGFEVNPKDGEPSVCDPKAGSRGHMDGVLDIHLPAFPHEPHPLFEFKCMVPDTIVNTIRGPVRAGDIQVGDEVFAWNDGVWVVDRVKGIHDNGIKPTVTIKTRQGRTITVTDNHPFLAPSGWVKAGDLTAGMEVRTPLDGMDFKPMIRELDEEAWFLGLMVGDGCLSKNALGLSAKDPDIVGRVHDYLSGTLTKMVPSGNDWRFTSGAGSSPNYVRDLMRSEGLEGKNSREKMIPVSVWSGSRRRWAEFLSGYFDADGTVVTTGSYPSANIASVNRPLLQDCQTMFSLLGVQASITEVRQTYKGAPHLSWRLQVRDAVSMKRLQRILTLRSSVKAVKLMDAKPKAPQQGHHLTARLGWDKIISVTRSIDQPTIGLEIETTHTHVTEGLVTHNTSNENVLRRIEDLDLEAFIRMFPVYYAQAQEYLRMSGRAVSVVLFMQMGFPWTLKEFHIPANHRYQRDVERKYLDVRAAVADGELPEACCAPGSKESKDCPARGICPIGRMTVRR